MRGQAQGPGQGVAVDVDASGRLPYSEIGALVLIPGRQGRAGLQRGRRVGGYLEVVFQHHVGSCEALGHTAPFQGQDFPQGEVAAGMDGDGVGRKGGLRSHIVGQRGVLDMDESQRSPGGVRVVGGNRGHLITHEPDAAVQDARVGSQPSGGRVKGREHGTNTGETQPLSGVDAQDAGVRVGTAKNGPVEHPRQLQVGGCSVPRLSASHQGRGGPRWRRQH